MPTFGAGVALGLYGSPMLPRLAELACGPAPAPVDPAIWPAVLALKAGADVLGYLLGAELAPIADAVVAWPGIKGDAAPPASCAAFGPPLSLCLAASEGSCGAEWASALESPVLSFFHHAIFGVVLQPIDADARRADRPTASAFCFMASVPCYPE